MRLFLLLLFLFTATLAPHPSAAGDDDTLFNTYVRAVPTRLAVLQVMRAQAEKLPGWCALMDFVPNDLEVIEPVAFWSNGVLHKGIWKDSWQGRGCNADRIYNVVTTVHSGGIVDREPMLPGSSRASFQLQHDILAKVLAATANTNQIYISCSSNMVTDTAYLGTENAASGAGRAWKEDWLVAGCGKMHLVAVHFVQNANGSIAVNINPNEVRSK